MDGRAIEKLAAALRKGQLPDAQPWDVAAAARLISDGLAAPAAAVSVDEARAALKVLNRHLHFDHARMLAQAWLDRRGFDATVTKHHAQALINLAALDDAEKLLREGRQRITQPGTGAQAAAELPEYEGLLGRLYKQRFVSTGNLDFLEESAKQYRAQYEGNPARPFWHGINVAALLARQERAGLAGAGAKALAEAVYAQVRQLVAEGRDDHWAAATASEACLALGRCDEAELWLYRFLHHPDLGLFDADSYGRQLREIWQADPSRGGAGCADRLARIMAGHVARTQSRWSVSPSAVPAMSAALARDPDAFEKNFSGEGSFSVDTLKRMLGACASIACVCNARGERLGTGFLIPGSALKDAYGARPVFVTNAHVIGEAVPNAIRYDDVRVSFEVESAAQSDPRFYKLAEVLFTSNPGDLGYRCPQKDHLDVTVARLQGLDDAYAMLRAAPQLPLIDPKSKAYVVGHPRGSGLQISLHDSLLLDIDDDERLVHYRTPTDPGSSGSPVFNSDWEVIAFHHGGSAATPRLHGEGRYEANEGIALNAVRRRLTGP
jgi:hypothetical protein